jgi:crotonobetainyl-CoA:carnitine CoA-transferase CaiB-like acyl-CoA transferase
MSNRPLAGIRIVDLTHVWAGPLATRMLGDLGADIVKVEAPLARGSAAAPPIGQGLWVGGEPGDDSWNRQTLTNKLNRSKRGICLDLKVEGSTDVLLALIGEADVVIENFSANAMKRLGLGYDQLASVKPDIVYVSMPGFGSHGPYSALTAFGPSVEPMTGLGALMGYSPEEPRNTAMALVDAIGGVSAASAVMTALLRRKQTGQGAFLELSLHEAGVSFFGDFLVDHQLGHPHEPIGNAHPAYAPNGIYPTLGEDAWIAIACPTPDAWLGLVKTASALSEELASFADPTARVARRADLNHILGAWTAEHDRTALADLLQSAGVPAGAVNAAPDFMTHTHLLKRGYWIDQATGDQPEVRYPGLAIRLNGERAPHGRSAPRFGEHNREVLTEWLGASEEEVDALLSQGALLDRPPA